jgi:hypothetical protein
LTFRHSVIEPWLWPNVVSLDAPAVAVFWQLLLLHCLHARVNPLELLVLGLAVWTVYVGDRILDALRPRTGAWEPARKEFYRRHLRFASMAGLCLVLFVLPLAYCALKRSAFYGGLALAFPVIGYFGFVHLAPPRCRARWPREAFVALLFTFGTFLDVWVVNGANIRPLAAPAALFSLLCWANISAIESWECESCNAGVSGAPSCSARWLARHLTTVSICIATLAALLGLSSLAPIDFCMAAFWSGIALALLGACRSQLRLDVLRVAADAALCTPLLALALAWLK